MKTLKCATFLYVFVMVNSLVSAADYDIEKLTTKHGKIYQEVEFLDADQFGLLFRHRAGIAKESFALLSVPLRDMFEPVDDIPSIIRPVKPQVENVILKKGEPKEEPAAETPEIVITFRIRQSLIYGCAIKPLANHHCSAKAKAFENCQFHRTPCNWPKHWHKFHYAHYLTNPRCREITTRQFLQTTGLLPRPCGVGLNRRFAGPLTIRFW